MKRRLFPRIAFLIVVLVSLAGFFISNGIHIALADFQPKNPPLTTPWTTQVSNTNPLPEYPRPQMTRTNWQSLNGQWQFLNATSLQTPPAAQDFAQAQTVLVPYPIESALSGIQHYYPYMWYHRTFTIPANWNNQNVLLNFGAVDWQATVYINGQNVGSHSGGYNAFSFDITSHLKGGDNDILVGVYAPVDGDNVNEPIGKQRLHPGGVLYTSASGIWQTVWLEPVPAAHITRLDMTPDVGGQSLHLTVQGAGINGQTVNAVATTPDGGQIGNVTGNVGTALTLSVPNPHLWSPNDPFLYNLQVSLVNGSTTVDQVGSYFGMRSLKLAMVNGVLRPTINSQFIFQMGTLDQGYWPDGIYTAPTDDALKFDIQHQKDLGYNTIRKHAKVESDRWFYWADKIGVLVLQDMPQQFANPVPAPARTEFENEFHEMITQHMDSPSIIQWTVFNESWGQYDQARLNTEVKGWDPSRFVNGMSGVNCCGSVDGGNGDVIDDHLYPTPGYGPFTPSATRYVEVGEFGGLGLINATNTPTDHQFAGGFAYEDEHTSVGLTNRYVGLLQLIQTLVPQGLSGAIYTQWTDVEGEQNGVMTYDRQVMKMDANAITNANKAVIATSSLAGQLPLNAIESFQVTTSGFTDRSIQIANSLGVTSVVNAGSDAGVKQAATFRVVAGLASNTCYSFASIANAGQYLRHSNFRIRSDANDGSDLFKQDATFCLHQGLSGDNISLESFNNHGYYIRHRNAEVWLDPVENSDLYRADATWHVISPWSRSGVLLTTNGLQSIQVTTTGFTDRSITHENGLGVTEVVNSGSAVGLRQNASFRIVPGLADNSCYSFESLNSPGQYFRHSNFRISLAAPDGSNGFKQDATFCAQSGLAGQGVSFQSYNYPDHYIRHFNAELWLAVSDAGGNASDNPNVYAQDTTWNVIAPWATA
jgi:hypothetical protein